MLFNEQRVGLPLFFKKREKIDIFEHEPENMIDFAIEIQKEKVYNEGATGRKEASPKTKCL